MENTEKKFIKCQLAILFNNTCLNKNIYIYICMGWVNKYICIYPTNVYVYNWAGDYYVKK